MATKLFNAAPLEPFGEVPVVRFQKWGGYNYAAIRPDNQDWFVTQCGRNQYRIAPMSWEELLTFIGDENWHSLELLS